jgi:hypothetical protein
MYEAYQQHRGIILNIAHLFFDFIVERFVKVQEVQGTAKVLFLYLM